MSNRTFAIIKPDAVKNKYTGLIYDRILKADFNILSSKLIKMTRKQAEHNSIEPLVTAPRSACNRLEHAFKVVVLPEPFAPRSDTTLPSSTSNVTPRNAKITWLYTTSILLTFNNDLDIYAPLSFLMWIRPHS